MIRVDAAFEQQIAEKIKSVCENTLDPAHDFLHVRRVVQLAKKLAFEEKADLNIVVPAAYFHDIVIIPKNDPRRAQASRISADTAIQFLDSIDYPHQLLDGIHHAIAAHSFSANITAHTVEARVVQDADRLDAIGAIGVARCFAVGGGLNRPFYHESDPFVIDRNPDDSTYTLDHFYAKLLKLADSMQTASGKQEGQKRIEYLGGFLTQLKYEIGPDF